MLGTMIAALALAQGQPALERDASCILDGLAAAERTFLLEDNGEASWGPVRTRIEGLAAACASRLGWSETRTAGLSRLAAAVVLRDGSRATLSRTGIPPPAIDRWFARQDDMLRTNLEVQQADLERLVLALAAENIPFERLESNGHTVGVYLAALIMIERHRRGLGD